MNKKKILKGSYCLIIFNSKNSYLTIGSLGKIEFKKGIYVYIGSAMNSLIPRLKRHLSNEKKKHWHVDYLLASKNTEIKEIFYNISEKRKECKIAQNINGIEINSFGSSDCNCNSHLKYFKEYNEAIENVKNSLFLLDLEYNNLSDLKHFINI